MRAAALVCLGVGFLAGGGCTNTTVDLFDPDLGLLAHWALDETPPTSIALDSSGFGNHGSLSVNPPTATSDTPPVHFPDPYSLSFNGQDQWVEIGNPELLNLGGPVTIAAWVRATAVDGYRDLVAHGFRSDPNYELSLRIYSGSYQFTYWDSIDHAAIASVPASDVGTWIHLCGVFDGATYSLYRNGAIAASLSDPTAPPPNVDAIWAIGARAPQPAGGTETRCLQGEIDDVHIYGRPLSAAEVEALYRR